MFWRKRDTFSYGIGIAASAIGHLIAFIVSLALLQHSPADAIAKYEVFSVTLEGGEKLGGISQVPEEKWTKKALPLATSEQAAEPEKPKPEAGAKLDQPSVVDDPQRLLEEQRKRDAEEKKKRELEEAKRKTELEKERKERAEKERAEKEKLEKEQEEKERKTRDRALQRAIASAANRYRGESANAGGEGFGAAALGGKGMGGGRLESVEFIAYRNQLEAHIKSGWRWLPSPQHLVAQVEFSLLPNGVVQSADIIGGSGNRVFDESALRAVYKASPMPEPPANVADRFRVVRITFDSQQ